MPALSSGRSFCLGFSETCLIYARQGGFSYRGFIGGPPLGEVSAAIVSENVGTENVEVPVNVGEVPGSQASQSVLGEGVVAASVVEEVSASSQAPSEMSGGDMDLDSLDLRDNGLDEVVSQPLPMSGETLFEGVSESASGGGGGLRVRPLSRLKRLHV